MDRYYEMKADTQVLLKGTPCTLSRSSMSRPLPGRGTPHCSLAHTRPVFTRGTRRRCGDTARRALQAIGLREQHSEQEA